VADSAILAAGGADAPLSYLVPGSAVITIKQIHVKYVDNGAGGDWLPAVRIVNDAGHTMGTAADQGVKVTAGGDADTSFFPGVKHAAAASVASSNVFARAYRDALGGAPDPVQTVPSGATRNGSFAHTFTTDSSVIDWTTSVLPNDTAELNVVGTYVVWATTHWSSSTPDLTTTIMDPSQSGFPHTANLPTGNPAFGDAIGSAQSQDYNVLHVTTPSISIHVAHGNAWVANADVQQCYFSILYIPTA
jgi:hypothetical protein